MKIHFVRSGGLAGLRLTASLDAADLPPEEASRLRELVESSGFFQMDQRELNSLAAADRFQYQLEIKSQIWGEHTLVVAEPGVPDELRGLLQELTAIALQARAPRQGRGA